MRDSGGCYLTVIVIVLVFGALSALWSGAVSVVHWMTGNHSVEEAESRKLLAEARDGVAGQEEIFQSISLRSTMKRETWDAQGGKLVYAGEKESKALYLAGGEGHIDCLKEITPSVEGRDQFSRREFSTMFKGGKGATLTTRQVGWKEGPEGWAAVGPDMGIEALIESQRPARMAECDEATGWNYAVYGAWPGGTDTGVKFSEMLDGKVPGVKLTAKSNSDSIPAILIRAEGLGGPGKVDLYWLDINDGYEIFRWEERVVEGAKERVVAAADMSHDWWARDGLHYPGQVTFETYGPGGNLERRDTLVITGVYYNSPGLGEKDYAINVPAGKVKVKEAGKADTVTEGTAAENTAALAKRIAGDK